MSDTEEKNQIKEWSVFYAVPVLETNTVFTGKFLIADADAEAPRKALLDPETSVKLEVTSLTIHKDAKPIGIALAHYVHDLTDEWPLLVYVVPPLHGSTEPWSEACKLAPWDAHLVVPDLIVFMCNVPGIQTTRRCTIVERIRRDQIDEVLKHTERPEGPLLAIKRIAPSA